MKFSRFAYVLAAAPVLASTALAGTTPYFSEAAWAAATSSNSSFGFAGIAPPGGDVFYPGGIGPTIDGVSFTDTDAAGGSELFVVDNAFYYAYGPVPTLSSQQGPNGDTILMTLSGATALGFDLGTWGNTDPITVTVNGTSYNFSGTNPADFEFFGVTSTSPITSLLITALPGTNDLNTDVLDVNQVYTGTAAAVAVPGPAAAVPFGLLLLLRRRRRSAA